MKKLVRKITFFVLPILIVLGIIEVFYRVVPNNYIVKNRNVIKNYETAEVLILGNSHTFYGLNPAYFDKPTFNLSNISQTLYFDKLLFDKHIDKFKKLKYVILNVEYFSLGVLNNSSESDWRKYYYEMYMDLDVPIIEKTDINRYLLSSPRGFNANIKLMQRYFADGTIIDCNDSGFGINYTKEKIKIKDIYEDALVRVKGHENNNMNFSENNMILQKMIDKCNSLGIKVIIVTMPVSKPYAKGVNQKKLGKIVETCLSLENKNANVHYINLFNDSRFTNEDFYDADHLHTDGARKCSKIINSFIN
jgi:hypothetical protein